MTIEVPPNLQSQVLSAVYFAALFPLAKWIIISGYELQKSNKGRPMYPWLLKGLEIGIIFSLYLVWSSIF